VEYLNGRTQYEATFVEGRPKGEMIRYYETGAVRARMMFDSALDRSYTKMFYKNGRIAAEGWYLEKRKDSVWTYYSELDKSVRIREPYLDGKLEGEVRSYYENHGISETVSWKQNIKEGPWKQFYNNGSPRLSSQYENNQLQGFYKIFYADSALKVKGEYLDHKATGTWTYYDESGKEVYSLDYLLGKPVDIVKYNQWIQDSLKNYEVATEPESDQQYE